LRWFLPEDVMSKSLLQHEVRRWLTESTTAVRALLDDEAVEAIRADLISGHHRDACKLLLNRAVQLRSLRCVVPDLSGTVPTRVGASW
jgi:hypothetical protein